MSKLGGELLHSVGEVASAAVVVALGVVALRALFGGKKKEAEIKKRS